MQRGADSGRASAALQARAFTAGGEVHIPSHHGPLDSGPGAALLAHELVHVTQQRRLGDGRPAEHTSGGQALERQAQRVEQAVAQRSALPLAASNPAQIALSAGLGTLDGDGSVVFNPPAGETTHAASVPPAIGVQRAAEETAASAPPPGPAAASDGPAGGQSNEQLEELAKNLYDKIRERLKAELRLDRERWGRVTDLAR